LDLYDQSKLLINEFVGLMDDNQLMDALLSLTRQSRLCVDTLPARQIVRRIETSDAPTFKLRVISILKQSSWGRTLVIESNSPTLASEAQSIANEACHEEGRLGVAALAYLSRRALKENNQAAGWALYCSALNRLDGQSLDLLRPLAKIIERHRAEIIADRTLKIAILGTTTTHYLSQNLKMECAKIGIMAEIYEGMHGGYRQEVLNPLSNLYSFSPEVVIFWSHSSEFQFKTDADLNDAQQELRELWTTLLSRNSCRIIQCVPDKIGSASDGILNWAHNENGCMRLRNEFFAKLALNAPPSVWLCDMLAIRISGGGSRSVWENTKDWYTLQQSPGLVALELVAASIRSLIQISVGRSKKLLILDLDNTLWGGVVGEDSALGLVIGADSPVGRAYLDFQWYLKGLKDRGILLAVCSKNNEEDAKIPFAERNDLPLKLADFVVFKANWESKVDNIREIIATINIGSDSVVFIDDNPLERLLVRTGMPAITVPSMPLDPAKYIETIQNSLFFESYRLSSEDRDRTLAYSANTERNAVKPEGLSIDDYLKSLQMTCACQPLNEENAGRVYQLLQKTNQFNLTNKRHSEDYVQKMIHNSNFLVRTFTLSDKFGNHGLIGVLITKLVAPDAYEIDTWLMSCRVLGRKMEDYMMDDLVRSARISGVKRVFGRYVKSSKNVIVADLLVRMGFSSSTNATDEFMYLIPASSPILCDFITSGGQ
jgi:FkbH-like protein